MPGPGPGRAASGRRGDRIPARQAAAGRPGVVAYGTQRTGSDHARPPPATPRTPMSISRSSGLGLFGPLDGPRGLTRSGPTTEDYSPYRSGASGWPRSAGGTTRGTGGRCPCTGRTHHAALDVGPAADASEEGGRHMGDYAKALGGKLRAIRQQQGLSLHGVEEKSEGRWKAVVVGLLRARRPRRHRAAAGRAGRLLRRAGRRAAARRRASRPAPSRHQDRDQPGAAAAAARRQGRARWPGTPRRSRASAATTTARCSRSGPRTCAPWRSSTTRRRAS